MRFKLKQGVGNHTETDPKTGRPVTYKSGDGQIIESDSDLVARFPEKFERVVVGGEAVVQDPSTPEEEKTPVQEAAEEGAKDVMPPEEPEVEEPEAEEPDEDEADEPEGKPVPKGAKDVTDKFPRAEEEELKVFYKKGKGFFVTEEEETSIALNEKRLKKAQVEEFIDDYLDDEE